MTKIKNISITVFLCTFLMLLYPISASALTIPNLYSDLSENTQVSNMVDYACRYDSFDNAKYIAFRDTQNSYYLVWGDKDAFTVVNGVVSASAVSYVRYYRPDSSSAWRYVYLETDTVSVNCDKLVTANLVGVEGFISQRVDDWQFSNDVRGLFTVVGTLIIFGLAVLICRR